VSRGVTWQLDELDGGRARLSAEGPLAGTRDVPRPSLLEVSLVRAVSVLGAEWATRSTRSAAPVRWSEVVG
jgi:hypothetical protein